MPSTICQHRLNERDDLVALIAAFDPDTASPDRPPVRVAPSVKILDRRPGISRRRSALMKLPGNDGTIRYLHVLLNNETRRSRRVV